MMLNKLNDRKSLAAIVSAIKIGVLVSTVSFSALAQEITNIDGSVVKIVDYVKNSPDYRMGYLYSKMDCIKGECYTFFYRDNNSEGIGPNDTVTIHPHSHKNYFHDVRLDMANIETDERRREFENLVQEISEQLR